eukprot:11214423-Lingulodinium_polyedra.AAC.1
MACNTVFRASWFTARATSLCFIFAPTPGAIGPPTNSTPSPPWALPPGRQQHTSPTPDPV